MSAPIVVEAPCARCPFRRDVPIYLRLDRRREIVHAVLVEGREFWCHQTTDWTDEEGDEEYALKGGERVCAGAARMVDEAGGSTQLMRISERLSGRELRLERGAAVWSVAEFTSLAQGSVAGALIYEDPVEEIVTCGTCEPGCLAPAGYRGVTGAVVHGATAADGACVECGEGLCSNCADEDGRCIMCRDEEADG